MRPRLYLDWNATAPLRAEARAAMLAAMDLVGNPSSVHAEGRAARALVERARAQVAAAVGAQPDEVVFTSGATEAASVLRAFPRVRVDPTAHDALWSHRRGDGAADVYAMGLANSETGIVTEPPARGAGGWALPGGDTASRLLLDVTQAVGRLPFAFGWSGADLAVLSAHKLGGPKGAGALLVRQGLDVVPLALGGGQELSRRAGTENLTGIAGFGAAAEAAQRDLERGIWQRVAEQRDLLERALEADCPGIILVGRDRPRLPNTLCLIAPGWKGETQVMAMDLQGFAVSAGSACSSGKVTASRVLRAMGHSDAEAGAALRVSLGPGMTDDDVLRFAAAYARAFRRQGDRMQPVAAGLPR